MSLFLEISLKYVSLMKIYYLY